MPPRTSSRSSMSKNASRERVSFRGRINNTIDAGDYFLFCLRPVFLLILLILSKVCSLAVIHVSLRLFPVLLSSCLRVKECLLEKARSLFEAVVHVPPGHPETMKKPGAANVQTYTVSSDLSVCIRVHPWFEPFSLRSLKIDPGHSKRATGFLKLSNVSAVESFRSRMAIL